MRVSRISLPGIARGASSSLWLNECHRYRTWKEGHLLGEAVLQIREPRDVRLSRMLPEIPGRLRLRFKRCHTITARPARATAPGAVLYRQLALFAVGIARNVMLAGANISSPD